MVQQATQPVSQYQEEAHLAVERIGAFAAAARAQQLKPNDESESDGIQVVVLKRNVGFQASDDLRVCLVRINHRRKNQGHAGILEHRGNVYAFAVMACSTGKVNWKVTPRSGFPVAHKRLPCDSIIDRLIDRPMPLQLGSSRHMTQSLHLPILRLN